MKGTHAACLVPLTAASWACVTKAERVQRQRLAERGPAMAGTDAAEPSASPGVMRARADRLSDAAPGPEFPHLPNPDAAPDMVIRSGQANVQVDSLERAVAAVPAPAARPAAYVANTPRQTARSHPP